MRLRLFSLAVLAVVLFGFARADNQSLRKLCIDTPTIVLADPLDPITPTRFKVVLVLRGKGIQPGQVLAPTGLTAADVQTFDGNLETGKPRPRRISQALLFLTGGSSPRLIRDGLRLCTEEGQVLAPVGEKGKLEVRTRLRWPGLVARLRTDIADVDQLMAYRRLARPQRRTQALLDWVRRHRGDFNSAAPAGLEDEAPAGWDNLEMAVFDWLLDGARPDDGWSAVKLYAELNRGQPPQLRSPTFSTPEGRAFLVRIVLDEKRLSDERSRALQVLGQSITIWPNAEERRQGARPMTVKEQEGMLDQFASLLKHKDESFRTSLVRTIARLSIPPDRSLASRRTARILPALVAAYKPSHPGTTRDELSAIVCSLASPSQWKELTNNPPGVCVYLADLERNNSTISFWLTLTPGDQAVYAPPVLVLEKLGTLGFVAERKQLPLTILNLERPWSLGWTGTEALAVRQILPTLHPGTTYRLRVEGTIGKGKDQQKWRSEPKRFSTPAVPAFRGGPGPGQYYEKMR